MAFTEFAGNKRLLWIAEEWQRNADELAVWAMERLVNRRDVWGQYTLKGGEVHVVTLPIKERRDTGSDMVTLNKLRRHFGGRAVSHLIGLHTISDHETCKWFAIDVDLHDETIANADEIALANLAACREWANRLRDKLLDPCIIDSNGIGGFHLLVLLDREYPIADVYEFVAEIRTDYEKFGLIRKPELFPSKPKTERDDDHLGSWLRLPGRHHTRPHYSRVWNFDAVGENEWLEGAEAIEALLSLQPAALPLPSDAKKLARRVAAPKHEALSRKPRVCVDLDGVLAKYDGFRGREHIGAPLPGALEFAWSLAKIADIIVFSSRCSQDNAGEEPSRLTPAQLRIRVIDWLEKYKFPYTDVYVGQGKPRVAAFIDDRAVNCSPQTQPDAFDKTFDAVKGMLYSRSRSNGIPPAPGNGQPASNGESKTSAAERHAGNGAMLEISEQKLAQVIKSVQEFYEHETGELYSDQVVAQAVNKWLELHFDWEDLEELFVTPHLGEAKIFRKILEDTAATSAVENLDAAETELAAETEPSGFSETSEGDESVFTGFRQYSPERLAAMISYFAEKGKKIYKTKLNKLLFYADFINFYLNGKSISGANYVHLPFGPVPDQYEYLLKKLTSTREIQINPIKTRKGTANQIDPGVNAKNAADVLSPEELATLDWILASYGQMTTEEISELSHREKAYHNTYPNEKIAYGYAKFFEKLPEKKETNKSETTK